MDPESPALHGIFNVFQGATKTKFVPCDESVAVDGLLLTQSGTVCAEKHENVYVLTPAYGTPRCYSRYPGPDQDEFLSGGIREVGLQSSCHLNMFRPSKLLFFDLLLVQHNGCDRFVVKIADPVLSIYCTIMMRPYTRPSYVYAPTDEFAKDVAGRMLAAKVVDSTLSDVTELLLKKGSYKELALLSELLTETGIRTEVNKSDLTHHWYYMMIPVFSEETVTGDVTSPVMNTLDLVDMFDMYTDPELEEYIIETDDDYVVN